MQSQFLRTVPFSPILGVPLCKVMHIVLLQNDLDNADTSMLIVCSATHKTKVSVSTTAIFTIIILLCAVDVLLPDPV